jgi:macrolide transport system ATP-binding/permease protein
MNTLLRFLRKLAVLFRQQSFDQDLREEMTFHQEQAAKEFEAGGIAPEAARYAALRQFGNATLLQERSHEVVAFRAETVALDLRFALRQLRRSPGFAVTAVLVLALGIGASTAIFGFVDAVLIQPLPYANPNQLVSVDESETLIPRSNLSRDDYDDWKRLNSSLSSLDVYGGTGFLLRTGSLSEPIPAARVSDGFFRTLGVTPILGRDFRAGEDRPGQPKVAILSYGTWMKRFGGRRDLIGQSISLSGEAYTVVGILPRSFAFAPRASAELWVPLLDRRSGCEDRRSCHNLDGVGRLRNGVTVEAASADMNIIAARLALQYPASNKGQSASIVPLSEIVVGKLRPTLVTLLAGAGLLLLIACVNVASLVLVRAESRRRETAVRGALGATPSRLVRQFVTEGLLLASLGCAAGAVLAVVMMSLLARLVPKPMAQGMPFLAVVGLNRHTALFAAGSTLMAALLLAATPALRLAFREIHDGLTDGGKGAASRFWRRLGANLVVVELTVAVVLLAGAGLLAKSFYRLLHVETGIDPSHLATVYIMAPESVYGKPEQRVALYHRILEKVSAFPGVQSAGITSDLPLQCNCDTDWIRIPGRPFHGEHNEVLQRDVSPQYLPALKAKLVRGRMLTEADDASHPQVSVVNESMARKYFPGEDPLGKMIGDGDLTPKSMRQVVGVIEDVREGGLDDEAWPAEYFSIYHAPDNYFAVVARTTQDERQLLPVLVKTLREINPNLGVYGEITMQEQLSASQSALLHRFSTWLVGGFAALALMLGVVGLYGVVAYSVSQRTREIGVRMALGAQRGAIQRLVLKEAGWLTAMGIIAGLICSIATAHLMRSLLFNVSAWDLSTLVAVAAVLGFSALLASLIPARRASSVDPVKALSAE